MDNYFYNPFSTEKELAKHSARGRLEVCGESKQQGLPEIQWKLKSERRRLMSNCREKVSSSHLDKREATLFGDRKGRASLLGSRVESL